MSNEPCRGCWWLEGGRCYQDGLADIHGMTKAPRNGIGAPGNGLEITDALLTACAGRDGRKSKAAVIARFAATVRAAGVEFVHIGVGEAGRTAPKTGGGDA